jgi:hypothetical protein
MNSLFKNKKLEKNTIEIFLKQMKPFSLKKQNKKKTNLKKL